MITPLRSSGIRCNKVFAVLLKAFRNSLVFTHSLRPISTVTSLKTFATLNNFIWQPEKPISNFLYNS